MTDDEKIIGVAGPAMAMALMSAGMLLAHRRRQPAPTLTTKERAEFDRMQEEARERLRQKVEAQRVAWVERQAIAAAEKAARDRPVIEAAQAKRARKNQRRAMARTKGADQ